MRVGAVSRHPSDAEDKERRGRARLPIARAAPFWGWRGHAAPDLTDQRRVANPILTAPPAKIPTSAKRPQQGRQRFRRPS
eukprot:763737-Prymnesium_polylepis.1